MRPGPAVRFHTVFEFGLPACEFARVCEAFHPFGAVGVDDAELKTAGIGAGFVAKEFTASFEPPEHSTVVIGRSLPTLQHQFVLTFLYGRFCLSLWPFNGQLNAGHVSVGHYDFGRPTGTDPRPRNAGT